MLYYEDQKHGPSLELTWSNRRNAPKHYHVNYMKFVLRFKEIL